jgi:tRNA (cmo5U34)-methyltransferase
MHVSLLIFLYTLNITLRKMKKNQDTIFHEYLANLTPFRFDEKVAQVFDDMAQRSIPDYHETLKTIAQMAKVFYKPHTLLYDLGCSTGNASIACANALYPTAASIYAVDTSIQMIERFLQNQKQLAKELSHCTIYTHCMDVLDIDWQPTSVVLLNYVLQFLHPDSRIQLLTSIRKNLIPGGILILSEKVISPLSGHEQIQQNRYYSFKQNNGYSNLEIAQKREALENVLVPDSIQTHQERLLQAGFLNSEVWWRNMNFCSLIAW